MSERIFVEPTWYDKSDYEFPKDIYEKEIIKMDPGSAFGSGTHATTMTSAQMIDKYLEKNMKVLDLGTGSGILAIVAAKLGAENIDAIDIDTNAIKVASENAVKNDVADKLNLFVAELPKLEKRYDLIIANLVATLIIDLAEEFAKHLKPTSKIILSGIVEEKAADVMEKFSNSSFELVEKVNKDTWVTLVYSFIA